MKHTACCTLWGASPGGHEAAARYLEELLGRIGGRLRSIVNRYRIPARDAEDILQTALLIFWTKRSGIANPEAWLVATVRSRCLMYWRAKRSDPVVIAGDAEEAVRERLARGQFAEEGPRGGYPGWRLDVAEGLKQLPRRGARVLWLGLVEGFNEEEVAAATGYRPSSVRKVRNRAVRQLRHELERSGAPPREETTAPDPMAGDTDDVGDVSEEPEEGSLETRLETVEARQARLGRLLAEALDHARRRRRGSPLQLEPIE